MSCHACTFSSRVFSGGKSLVHMDLNLLAERIAGVHQQFTEIFFVHFAEFQFAYGVLMFMMHFRRRGFDCRFSGGSFDRSGFHRFPDGFFCGCFHCLSGRSRLHGFFCRSRLFNCIFCFGDSWRGFFRRSLSGYSFCYFLGLFFHICCFSVINLLDHGRADLNHNNITLSANMQEIFPRQ